ncbi:Craniofacial development protein 2 [Blattella germanica]|nr:Craniofacial development protein 2 [Blattella germanica]
MTIIAVYSPEEGKDKESKIFYQNLQEVLDKTNKNDIIMLAGDLNARVGNVPIQNVVGTNGEITKNINGNRLIDFASYNELKILNTFFKHKDIHKFTWRERGSHSIIDYVIVNRTATNLAQDVRVFRGSDVSSDHFLVVAKFILHARWKKTPEEKKDSRRKI